MRKILVASFGMLLLGIGVFSVASEKIAARIVYRPLTAYEQELIKKIHQTGVAVIRQGDRLTLVLPVDSYFQPATTDLKRERKPALRSIALLVRFYSQRFAHPRVYVTGYADKVYSYKTQQALSKQYAQIVSSYLWTFGVPSGITYTRGAGSANTIADENNPRGAGFNRRVEIEIR